VRRGIKDLLATEPDIAVVGEAADGRAALAGVQETSPDLVLMDLVMPKMDGIETIRQLRAAGSEARILVLTSFATDDKVFPAIKAGALGYLIKDTGPEELVRAIRLMIAAEYEAIQLYQQLAESTDNVLARNVLQDIADEEKVHAGEFLRLLKELDPDEMRFYEEGAREVEEDFLGGGSGAETKDEGSDMPPSIGTGLGIGSLKK